MAPERLYKFRAFDARTLELLIDDKVYFANPADFNDPLDSRPSVEVDLGVEDLEKILEEMTTRRISAEMRAAAATIRYSGPRTLEHIERHARREVARVLKDIAYMATDPDYDLPDPQAQLLGRHIEEELLRQYGKGILSLATRYECPLMWSHYGDQHKGVCIGYSVPRDAAADVHRVEYSGSRRVKASDVKAMLAGNKRAHARVDKGVLLRKAAAWRYEHEWRILRPRGQTDSPLELREIIFGMRCLPAARHAVLRSMRGREGEEVRFYEMHDIPGEFDLRRRGLDWEGLSSQPRNVQTLLAGFDEVTT